VSNASDQSTSSAEIGPPSRAYAWYVVGVLVLVTTLSYLDRQALGLMVVPIQNDLHMSDTQMGLLLGPAFVALYAFAGLPIGALADAYSRRNILAAGLAVWSVSTVACAFAASFWSLAIARAGVGLGEACLVPCAFSLAGDYFTAADRGRGVAAVTLGVPIGAGLALFGGGFLLQGAQALNAGGGPWAAYAPWQLVFIACGLPGGLALLLMCTVREPRRAARPKGGPSPVEAMLAHLRAHPATVALALVAYVCFAFMQYGITAWTPVLLARRHGLDPAHAAFFYGAFVICLSPIAALSGGVASDWMARRWTDGRFRLALLLSPLFLPFVALATLSSGLALTGLGLAGLTLVGGVIGTSVYVAFQEIAPPTLRSQMLALYGLAANLLGLGLGPVAVAFFTDSVLHSPSAVNLSLLLVCGPVSVLAVTCFTVGLRRYRTLRQWVRDETEAKPSGVSYPASERLSEPAAAS